MRFNLYILTILAIFGSAIAVTGQVQVKAFKNQDYTAIEAMLSPDVTVKVNSKTKITGKKKGLIAIKKALTAFSPTRMEMRHKGSAEAKDNNYLIAKLINADDEKMRVFIHLENGPNGKHICDIKIRRS